MIRFLRANVLALLEQLHQGVAVKLLSDRVSLQTRLRIF